MTTATSSKTTTIDPMDHGSRRPGVLWWLLAVAATLIAGYGITLRDGRPNQDAVPGMPWLDEVHFVTGGVALLIGIWCFRRDVLAKHARVHRRLGQLYIVSAVIAGLAGLAMAAFSMGGLQAHLGFALLAILWLVTTGIGWRLIHHGRVVFLHRRWMVRSYALCCGAISLRLELPLLIEWTGSFAAAYPIVAWTAWVPNVLIAELWLWCTHLNGRWRGLVLQR